MVLQIFEIMSEEKTLKKIEKNKALIEKALECGEDPKLMQMLIKRLSQKNKELRESLK